MLVFALTGCSVVLIRKPVYHLLHITPDSPMWVHVLAIIFIGLPLYQIMLLAWGSIFGQWHYFIAYERKVLRRLTGRARLPVPATPPVP